MTNVCKEEGVPLEQVFFAFICCWLYRYRLSKHKFCVCKGQLMKILGFVFNGDQEKNYVEFSDAGILRV